MKIEREIVPIDSGAEIGEVIQEINKFIDSFNFLSRYISLKDNFDGQLVNVKIAAGAEAVIAHNLGIKPNHRIILNQVGNGVISDIPSGWNKYQIKLKNNGAVEVTATIMILKE